MTTLNILLAIHVLGVVWWVGGVALVAAILLPMWGQLPAGERIDNIRRFEARFANQARIAVLAVGISGFWMVTLVPPAWAHSGWVGLMMFVWALFTVMLFIAEPLQLPARLGLIRKPAAFLALHAVLLTLALAAIVGGVIGSRGGF